ncbi:hypothetical protein O1G22_07975 [Streptomyces camelliae]|uniref:Uncharacterized protein n=1 Tax=Streptomyces camelliae TaxID=3004093 RepID=A0ABY7P0A7_9ACTN|nr:hypothetical protein [Streptomyces sp. HUAS 2-6]WBO62758.1 hypothetical protein O1G22_07975 [Streptomyces sp. HUAS 2-6]
MAESLRRFWVTVRLFQANWPPETGPWNPAAAHQPPGLPDEQHPLGVYGADHTVGDGQLGVGVRGHGGPPGAGQLAPRQLGPRVADPHAVDPAALEPAGADRDPATLDHRERVVGRIGEPAPLHRAGAAREHRPAVEEVTNRQQSRGVPAGVQTDPAVAPDRDLVQDQGAGVQITA